MGRINFKVNLGNSWKFDEEKTKMTKIWFIWREKNLKIFYCNVINPASISKINEFTNLEQKEHWAHTSTTIC